MELQFYPASGRRHVRRVALGPWGERAVIALAAGGTLLALSLWITVPTFAARRLREETRPLVFEESRTRRAEREEAARLALALKERALDRGDLLSRVAFLYAVSPLDWPATLDAERVTLAGADPERLVASLSRYAAALETARRRISEKEASDPGLASRVPALLPVAGKVYQSSALFGPRVSPWTGEEEFFPGVDIAAPAGVDVLAPGEGTVAFTGAVRRFPGGWLWRLGNVVVLSHGSSGATVYGHLARIDVRRGQRVARGQTLGTVGSSGWSLSPQLHYEYWRPSGGSLRPTDPLFALLDHRLDRAPVSLERMEGTSAPGDLEPLPGVTIGADSARGTAPRRAPPRGRRARRRI